MGSLTDELQRREAAAREEAEELRARIAQLTARLAGVEERLSRLVIARETVDEVLSEAGAQAAPAAVPEETARSRLGHLPPVGVVSVPPWRAGLETSALPESCRDLVEVVQDAGRPVRAVQIAAQLSCRWGLVSRLSAGPGEGRCLKGYSGSAGLLQGSGPYPGNRTY